MLGPRCCIFALAPLSDPRVRKTVALSTSAHLKQAPKLSRTALRRMDLLLHSPQAREREVTQSIAWGTPTWEPQATAASQWNRLE